MNTRTNYAIKILLVLGMLFMAPVFISSGTAMAADVVDINRADVATMIANWKGIGEKKAKAIVAYRKKNGPFASINDLANVKGIGEGIIKNNKKYMSVKGGIKATSKATTKKKPAKAKANNKKSSSKNKPADKKATSKKKDSKKSTSKKSSSKKPTTKKSTSKKKKTDKKKKTSS